jgi:hypothetical protein
MNIPARGGLPYGIPLPPEPASGPQKRYGESFFIEAAEAVKQLQKIKDGFWKKRRYLLLNAADALETYPDLIVPLLQLKEQANERQTPVLAATWRKFAGPTNETAIQAIRNHFGQDTTNPEKREKLRELTKGNPYECLVRSLKKEPFIMTSLKLLADRGDKMDEEELERHISNIGNNLASRYAAAYVSPERRAQILKGLNPHDFLPHVGPALTKEEILKYGASFPEITVRYSHNLLSVPEIMDLAKKGAAWVVVTTSEISSKLTVAQILRLLNLPTMASLWHRVVSTEHPEILRRLSKVKKRLDPLMRERLMEQIAEGI